MILVSACLLGENCKYSGGNNDSKAVHEYLKGKAYLSVCPEELGGLFTPRYPCEIVNTQVMNSMQEDVTVQFHEGAKQCVKIAKENNVTLAILQVRSPSCGIHRIYDGTFSGHLIEGEGITAQYLREAGISLLSSEEVSEMMETSKNE